VRWSFVIEGQPVSWNAAYKIGTVNRRAYNRADHDIRTIIKTDEAVAYTTLAMLRAREKKPSGWAPKGFVVVEFKYYLGRDVDCDNVMKLVNDGIEAATGVDDRWYLPRAMSKVTGLRPEQRRVEITVDG
jgi:hypothetical protein